MKDRIWFVFKVLAISTIFSVLIKYGGRLMPIAPTSINAGIAVLLPTAILALLLIWRSRSRSIVPEQK